MKEDNIIKKWLNDDLSPEEKEAFRLSENASFNEAIIKVAQRFKAPLISGMPSFVTFEQNRLKNYSSKTKTTPWLQWVSGVAAVFIIAIGLSIWFSNTSTTIETSIAQTENILLPDTSQVVLNAKSQISFNASTWDENRLVTLEGEAFFDVAKGTRFDVKTSEGIISVLGTKFNVKQRGAFLKVSCYEGKVKVIAGDVSEVLTAGQQLSMRNGKPYQSLTTLAYPEWQDHLSRFKNAPLSEVVAALERQYKVDITLLDIDATLLFSGAFEHSDLETALRSITQPLGIQYEVKNNENVTLLNAQ